MPRGVGGEYDGSWKLLSAQQPRRRGWRDLRVGVLLSWAGVSLLAARAYAQTSIADSLTRGPLVESLRIVTRSVFDSAETRFLPFRLLNLLHAETRTFVVRRELLVLPGQRVDSARLLETERNLRALGIFQEVSIREMPGDSGVILVVETTDAWTTTPSLDFKSSGEQLSFSVSLQERNFLGTATTALLQYRDDPDRSSLAVAVDAPRVTGGTVGLAFSYLDRSDGRAAAAGIRSPFVHLGVRRGWTLVGQYFDGRVLRFAGGQPRPVDSLHRRLEVLQAEAAVAPRTNTGGYVRFGLQWQWRRDGFAPLRSGMLPSADVFVTAGPYVAVRRVAYMRLRNFAYMRRVEDIDLGRGLRLALLAAPQRWGYPEDAVGISLESWAGHRLPRGFARYALRASRLFAPAQNDSGGVAVGGTAVLQPEARHLLMIHADAGLLQRPAPGGEFDLGLGDALRAFPAHSFTGDRRFLATVEYRYLLAPDLAGLAGLGVAVFATKAGAWYHGQATRSGAEIGAGLRVASLKEASPVWRLDLSHRSGGARPAGWVFSVGQGFVFSW